MKIMSFNTQHCLNYVERKIDFDIMAKAIVDCGADIVGLNEMRDGECPPEFDAQCRILAEKSGLENYYFAKALQFKEGGYGNGMISRYKIISAETIHVPDPEVRKYNGYYEHRVLLKARLENGLTVMIIHFGLNPDEAENAVKTVLENLESEKCVLMGDFNVTPDDPVLAPIRERMNDAAALFGGEKLSFPSDKPTQKIDYIFASPDIEIVSADIPAIVASDHRPHVAEIKL
jgi:endonuclease/exonuclease/phosphatase family metal-dependent hydrolase